MFKLKILINALKKAIIKKKNTFSIANNKFYLSIIKKLMKNKVISDYDIKTSHKLKCENKYINNLIYINLNFNNEIKKSVNIIKIKEYIKTKTVKVNTLKINYREDIIIFLSTTSGILTDYEAIYQNKGGVFLFAVQKL